MKRHSKAGASVASSDTRATPHDPCAGPSRKGATSMRAAAQHTLATLLLTLAGALMLASTPALASEFKLSSSFGAPGVGPGQFSGESPLDIAVESSTGDVFALDDAGSNRRVEKFGPEGEYLSEFNGDETPSGEIERETEGLAVDSSATSPSKGDVYVVNREKHVVERFKPKGPNGNEPNEYEYAGQLEGLPDPIGLTIDPKGDVYVADIFPNEVLEFDPEGKKLRAITSPGLTTPWRVAIAPNGDLYVANIFQNVVKLLLGPEGEVEGYSVLDSRQSTAVAVDPSGNGDVYVMDAGEYHVTEYEPSSGEHFEFGGGGEIGVSLDLAFSPFDKHLYVADLERNEVHVFKNEETVGKARPEVKECATTTPTPVSAVLTCTVDPDAAKGAWHLEYGELGSATVAETAEQEITSGGTVKVELNGLKPQTKYGYKVVAKNENGAVKGEEEVFKTGVAVRDVGGCGVTAIENEGATLNGSLEPLGAAPTTWRFQYGENNEYELETAKEESNVLAKQEPKVKITGLKPHHTYNCRLVAQDEYGTTIGASGEFTTTGPPILANQTFEKVGSVDAVVHAELVPDGLEGKTVASKYYVEYAEASEYQKTGKYGLKTPETSVGEEQGNVAALVTLNGLRPETEYHFRFVAADAFGTAYGPDTTFSTFSAIGSGLPDGRIYEMVSPPEDNNADIYAPEFADENREGEGEGTNFTGYPVESSLNGDAVTYVGDPSYGGNGSIGEDEGNQYLAVRAAGGWSAQNITPSSNRTAEYRAFSPDLSVGIIASGALNYRDPLSPEGLDGYSDLYTRTMSDGSYHALLSTPPPNRDSEEFGIHEEESPYTVGIGARALLYAGATSDFSHILFEANDALTPPAADPGREANNLYDSVDGQLSSVNVLPDGEPAPNATFGSYPPEPEEYNGFAKVPDFSHVISADGSRIFWTDLTTHQLFVREGGTRTVQVDASKAPAGEGVKEKEERASRSFGGEFQTASGDGSKVFFTDCNRLTEGSTAVFTSGCGSVEGAEGVWLGEGNDLYEYDVPSGELTDLTVDHNASDPLGADVQAVIGASEDGEYVYFVAGGVLAGENAEGRKPAAGQPNLYLLHEGRTTFIAALAQQDDPGGLGTVAGDWKADLGRRTAEVTPSGHDVVFESVNSLTAYNSEDAREVYVYDAESGQLSCASCLPTGEPPSGESYLPISGNHNATYQPRWISAEGTRVFFDSTAALAAHVTNRVTNVYEWERDGAGSCRDSRGCIYVLSGGTSPQGSFLAAASASGDDVFFVTRAQLVQRDGNENYNLYDAHVGGVLPPSEPECSGTGCQGVPLAPTAFEVPASVTFDGVGNFPPPSGPTVHKPPVKKKTVKKKHKKKRRKAGRARHAKRASRSTKRTRRAQGEAGRS